jgi:hypothetical protein
MTTVFSLPPDARARIKMFREMQDRSATTDSVGPLREAKTLRRRARAARPSNGSAIQNGTRCEQLTSKAG